jgi:hypothetical protein
VLKVNILGPVPAFFKENGYFVLPERHRYVSFCKNVLGYIVSWNCIRIHDKVLQNQKCVKIFQEVKHHSVYSNRASFNISANTINRIIKSVVEIKIFPGVSERTFFLVNKFCLGMNLHAQQKNFHILSSQHGANLGNIVVKSEER